MATGGGGPGRSCCSAERGAAGDGRGHAFRSRPGPYRWRCRWAGWLARRLGGGPAEGVAGFGA
ncbi:hypothetical protein BB737_18975, partial [Mycobacterium avium subsp. hominissuis]